MTSNCPRNRVVIRTLFTREIGVRLHAICGESELVLGLSPVRILQGEAPSSVRESVLAWAEAHRGEVMDAWRRYQGGHRPSLSACRA